MDTLILLFVIIAVISNLTKNRKKKAEKKNTWRPGGQQAQAQPRQAQAQPHRPAAQQTTMGEEIFPWVTPEPPKSTAKPAKPAVKPTRPAEGQSAGGSLGGPFTEGRSTQGSMAASSTEGMGTAEGTASAEGVGMGGSLGGPRPKPQANRRSRHVVQPFTEGNHQHTESSLTGAVACPPSAGKGLDVKDIPAFSTSSKPVGQYNLSFDRNSLIAGFLYGEILGKPRSLASHHGYRR